MKISARSVYCTLTVFTSLYLVNVVAARSPTGATPEAAAAAVPSLVAVGGNGPVSPLYLTAGDNGMNWIVQGTAVVGSWPAHHTDEYPVAVLNTVRTIGAAGGPGSDYS